MDPALQRRLIESVASAMVEHVEELSELDRAIGDGDHGLNMQRGFSAVLGQIDELAAKSPPDALKAIGTTLLMKVGGASGPLYGTLFMTLGKEWPAAVDAAALARALAAAIAALQRLGKSEVGQKTLLDVLAPVQQELAAGGAGLPARLRERAAMAAAATTPLRALRGRASFLGERSIGHMDPGARSSMLMIDAICRTLEG
jgi:dihydroxyacetone kinase-like protein